MNPFKVGDRVIVIGDKIEHQENGTEHTLGREGVVVKIHGNGASPSVEVEFSHKDARYYYHPDILRHAKHTTELDRILDMLNDL